MQKILLLALAGAFGTLARYFTSTMAHALFGNNFPWGTAAVNVMGCFLFGVFWSVSDRFTGFGPDTRAIVLIGFMGAFTTFSTFAFDTGDLIRNAQWFAATGNVLVQSTIGVALVFLGMSVGAKF